MLVRFPDVEYFSNVDRVTPDLDLNILENLVNFSRYLFLEMVILRPFVLLHITCRFSIFIPTLLFRHDL